MLMRGLLAAGGVRGMIGPGARRPIGRFSRIGDRARDASAGLTPVKAGVRRAA
jgi:hypothetical protein